MAMEGEFPTKDLGVHRNSEKGSYPQAFLWRIQQKLLLLRALRNSVLVTTKDQKRLKFITETEYDPDTLQPLLRRTRLNGKLHAEPDDSPSEVRYNHESRTARLSWHFENLAHRENGPSTCTIDLETERTISEWYYEMGCPRKPEQGPYRISYDEQGQPYNEEYATPDDTPSPESLEIIRARLEP
jgi:hypothetical protein